MSNRFKLPGILIIILLLTLPIAACWERAITLDMTVDTPQDGTTVASSSITVSGSVTKSAKVKINDVEVPIKARKFSTDLKLSEGNNVINVVATSGEETIVKRLTITYTPTKQ